MSNRAVKRRRKYSIDACIVMSVGKAGNFMYRAEGAGLAVSSQRRNPWSAVKARYIYENARSILSSVQKSK